MKAATCRRRGRLLHWAKGSGMLVGLTVMVASCEQARNNNRGRIGHSNSGRANVHAESRA